MWACTDATHVWISGWFECSLTFKDYKAIMKKDLIGCKSYVINCKKELTIYPLRFVSIYKSYVINCKKQKGSILTKQILDCEF
jgi:ribosomal protein S3AE